MFRRLAWMVRLRQDRQRPKIGQKLADKLDPLLCHVEREEGAAGEISSRPRQALRDAERDRVAADGKQDGLIGCGAHGEDRRSARDNEIGARVQEFRQHGPERRRIARCVAQDKSKVLALDIAALAHSLAKAGDERVRLRLGRNPQDKLDVGRHLSPSPTRQGRRGRNPGDHLSTPHNQHLSRNDQRHPYVSRRFAPPHRVQGGRRLYPRPSRPVPRLSTTPRSEGVVTNPCRAGSYRTVAPKDPWWELEGRPTRSVSHHATVATMPVRLIRISTSDDETGRNRPSIELSLRQQHQHSGADIVDQEEADERCGDWKTVLQRGVSRTKLRHWSPPLYRLPFRRRSSSAMVGFPLFGPPAAGSRLSSLPLCRRPHSTVATEMQEHGQPTTAGTLIASSRACRASCG